jgi:hypothetical protein
VRASHNHYHKEHLHHITSPADWDAFGDTNHTTAKPAMLRETGAIGHQDLKKRNHNISSGWNN